MKNYFTNDLTISYDIQNFNYKIKNNNNETGIDLRIALQNLSHFPVNDKTLIIEDYIARKIALYIYGFGDCCIGSPQENIYYNDLCEKFYNMIVGKLKPISINYISVAYYCTIINLIAFNQKSNKIELYAFKINDDVNPNNIKIFFENKDTLLSGLEKYEDCKYIRDSLLLQLQKKILLSENYNIADCYIVYFDKDTKKISFKKSVEFDDNLLTNIIYYLGDNLCKKRESLN